MKKIDSNFKMTESRNKCIITRAEWNKISDSVICNNKCGAMNWSFHFTLCMEVKSLLIDVEISAIVSEYESTRDDDTIKIMHGVQSNKYQTCWLLTIFFSCLCLIWNPDYSHKLPPFIWLLLSSFYLQIIKFIRYYLTWLSLKNFFLK